MKIKELIGHLEKIYKKYGDLEICLKIDDDRLPYTATLREKPYVLINKDNQNKIVLLYCQEWEFLLLDGFSKLL